MLSNKQIPSCAAWGKQAQISTEWDLQKQELVSIFSWENSNNFTSGLLDGLRNLVGVEMPILAMGPKCPKNDLDGDLRNGVDNVLDPDLHALTKSIVNTFWVVEGP